MLYRIKQFFQGLLANIDEDDIIFIRNYLNDRESRLFFSLPRYEKVHAIKVGREVVERSHKLKIYDIILVKAALLHDVGKLGSGLNIVCKSILVILDKIIPNVLKKFTNIKCINAYYNHPELSLKLINTDCEEMRFLILNHHNYKMYDAKLKLLQEADSKY